MTCCDWTGKNIFQSAGGTGSAGNPVFDNIDALKAFRVEPSQNGLIVWVLSVQDAFQYQNDSELPPDDITVVAPTAADSIGNWIRLQIPNERWAQQLAWHIKEEGGDDENDGATLDTPLKTHAELARRINGLTLHQPTTVTIMSDLHEVLRLDVTLGENEPVGTLHYVGQISNPPRRSSVGVAGGGISGVTPIDVSGTTSGVPNIPLSFADASVTNWVGDGSPEQTMIGHRIRIVSGTTANVNAAAWLAQPDPTLPNRVRSSPFFTPNSLIITPSQGDQYIVENQMRVFGFDLMLRRRCGGEPLCVIENLALTRPSESDPVCSTRLKSDGGEGRFVVRDCEINSPILEVERGNIENCLLTSTSENIVLIGQSILFRAGLTLLHGYVVDSPASVFFQDDHLVQGDGRLGMIVRAGVVEMNGLAFFDCNPALVMHHGGAVRVGFDGGSGEISLWGAGNGAEAPEDVPGARPTPAVVIEAGSILVYDSPNPAGFPLIAAVEGAFPFSVGTVDVGGTASQPPPFFNTNNGAGLVNRNPGVGS
jgi:hypothetical protein